MVTIKQIAQEVGISSSTVSIVLGGKAAERKISTATQEKIFAAAARLGYQPNMAARSLRGGSGANELVVAMFWAQDFRAGMMFRFWDGLRAEIEKSGTSGAAGHLPVCQRPPEGKRGTDQWRKLPCGHHLQCVLCGSAVFGGHAAADPCGAVQPCLQWVLQRQCG